MGALMAVSVAALLFFATAGGFGLALRSVCGAQRWKDEVRRGTERLKDRPSIPFWSGPTSCRGHGSWTFKGEFVRNQKGSIEALSCGLLVVLCFALVLQVVVWQKRLNQVQDHFRQTLCLKNAMLETKSMITRLNKINAVIVAGEVSSLALILTGIGIAARPTWEQVKKGLQLTQEGLWLKSQAEFAALKSKGCRLPITLWPSPYQWQGLLKRAPDGHALMRSQSLWWAVRTPLTNYVVQWKVVSDLSPLVSWTVW